MANSDAATSQIENDAAGQAELDAILGGEESSDSDDSGSGSAEEVKTEEPTETEETATETESSEGDDSGEESATESEEADEGSEDGEAGEDAEEESELSFDENDRDYSEAAYKKAAAHYSKTLGVRLDPDDPAHRALLKENMRRGEALKNLQAEHGKSATEEETATEEEAKADTTAVPATRKAPTAEQVKEYLDQVGAIAKARIVPAVADQLASEFVNALWPGKNLKLTSEQSQGLMFVFQKMLILGLDDAAPAILASVKNDFEKDPVWGRTRTDAIRANAFEHLDEQKDAQGNSLYPDMERLVNSGTLKRILKANPWIEKTVIAGDGRNPILNHAEQYKIAYKLAKGEQVSPNVVKKAVETGKKLATDSAKRIAAGRVASGKSKGGFSKPLSDAEKTVDDIVSSGGSRFAAAVAQSVPVRRPGQ